MPVNKLSCQTDGIFGTPPEPLFNNEENGASPEILQDWLISMTVTNSKNITAATVTQTCPTYSNERKETCQHPVHLHKKQYGDAGNIELTVAFFKFINNIFTHGSWSECVFLMCDRFELPCQAKFAALDIFDRFMLKHILDLYAHVQNSKSSSKRSDWECILGRVKNQAFLRILSCCQIASKLNSHYEVITVKRARRCLLDAGYSYSCESILQSEMRVLKTLTFKISRNSSLDFIEILLEILGYNTRGESLHIKVYHETAVKILTIICLHRHEVYNRLYLSTAGIGAGVLVSSLEQRSKLAAVMMDKMLLAVAVVTTAVHIIDSSLTQKVTVHLHKISEVPIEDIQDFVKVIAAFLRAVQNRPR